MDFIVVAAPSMRQSVSAPSVSCLILIGLDIITLFKSESVVSHALLFDGWSRNGKPFQSTTSFHISSETKLVEVYLGLRLMPVEESHYKTAELQSKLVMVR